MVCGKNVLWTDPLKRNTWDIIIIMDSSSKPLPTFEIPYTELPRVNTSKSITRVSKIPHDAFNIAQSPIKGQRDENIDAVCGPTLILTQLC